MLSARKTNLEALSITFLFAKKNIWNLTSTQINPNFSHQNKAAVLNNFG